jgi:ribonucleoside-diphosphate reductase alpha chain
MRFERLYTTEGSDPFDTVRWRDYTAADGGVYRLPVFWGQAACDVLAEKVFAPRPPQDALKPQSEGALPLWLCPQSAEAGAAIATESDLRDVLRRVAGGLCHAAHRAGLFDDDREARIFYEELCHVMLHRIALPEIALLATAGLGWAYGAAFTRPYIPAERIAPLPADFTPPAMPYGTLALTPDSTVADAARRLSILADIAALDGRAAPLSAVIPAEHNQALDIIGRQTEQEIDLLARDLGRRLMAEAAGAVTEACDRDALRGFDTAFNGKLSRAVQDMRAAGAPETLLRRAIDYAQQGFEQIEIAAADIDAPQTPPLQTVLSVSDDFIETALTGHGFLLRDAGEAVRHADAEALWARIGDALWTSGQPQFFFRDSAQGAGVAAHENLAVAQALVSVPGIEAAGAVLNLTALAALADTAAQAQADKTALLSVPHLVQAVRLLTAALDAALDMPSLSLATRARRPLVIGYSGLGGVLMSAGTAFDSDAAHTLGAQITALVSGAAQLASAEIADRLGAYDDYAAESRERLAAMRGRLEALDGARGTAKGVMRRLPVLNTALSPDKTLAPALADVWQRAYAIGKEQGFRHAHLTGLWTSLDVQALLGVTCRDIAPEAAPVRFEGFFGDAPAAASLYGKKLNPAVPAALKRLGYTARQIDDIHAYATGHGTLLDAPVINHATLAAKGVTPEMIAAVERLLPAAQDLRYVFNRWTLGAGADELPIGDAEDVLAALGFSDDDIDAASLHACGAMTLEGAPHLLPQHLDVFDCLLPSGSGIRRVGPSAQIAMQAAVEPFLCGAVLQTLILDHHTGIDEMQKLALMAWETGVKRVALWREGASLLQPAELLPHKWETSLFAEEEEAAGIRLPATPRRKIKR